MDSKATWVQQAGITPAKMILVGVLTVALGGVLYLQFGGSDAATPESTAQSPVTAEPGTVQSTQAETSGVSGTPASNAPKKSLALDNWQTPNVASVVQYDPFAVPAAFPQPLQAALDGTLIPSEESIVQDASAARAALEAERQHMQSELDGLRREGVRVIIKREDEYVAIVGDRELHVGDEFNGFTVIAIDANGVRVAKDLSP